MAGAGAPRSLSPDNLRVRQARRLARSARARAELDRFVIEGPGLIADAVRAGLDIDFVLAPDSDEVTIPLSGVAVFTLPERTFRSISTTTSPQPALAVAARPRTPVPVGAGLVLALAGVADPGNAGTLVRAAEGAGAAGVIMVGPSVDPFGPKAVRASAGSVFRLPVQQMTADVLADEVARLEVDVLGCIAGDAASPYDEVDLTGAPVVVVGNESHGIGDALRIGRWLSIPMAGGPESLNVAMAGTVVLFEALRQRRHQRP